MTHTTAPLTMLRQFLSFSSMPTSPDANPRRNEPSPGSDPPAHGGGEVLTLGELLAARAEAFPTRVAFEYLGDSGERSSWTYGELHRRALGVAAEVAKRTEPGDRAVLLYGPGLDFIAAYFGCVYAGVLPVPTTYPRPRKPMPRLEGIVRDCSPKLLLSTEALHADVQLGEASSRLAKLSTDACPPRESFAGLPAGPTDLAFLQYTSGSTSDPRGVMVTHANLLTNLEAIRRGFRLRAADEGDQPQRGVFWLPAFHDMGLIGSILTPIYVGGTSCLMSPATFLRRPATWLEEIARVRADISGAPNFAYRLCAEKAGDFADGELDLSSWRLAFCGAEPIDPAVLEEFASAYGRHGFGRDTFYPCYGLAETTLLCAGGAGPAEPDVLHVDRRSLENGRVETADPDGSTTRSVVSCGVAPADHELLIVDPTARTPLGEKTVGEVWVRGGSVASGYWGRDEENQELFRAKLAGGDREMLRTGDLGFLDGGRLFVVGRLKDVVIVRGRNHYPQDIEQTASEAHQAIDAGAAFAVDADRGAPQSEELVVVHQIDRAFRNDDLADIAQRVRSAIVDRHEVDPLAVVLIRPASLPTTSSGKVQRSRCRELFQGGELSVLERWDRPAAAEPTGCASHETNGRPAFRDNVAGRTPDQLAGEIEVWLVGWLPVRAGLPDLEVSPTTPFADLGIDSLTAVEMALELDQITGLQLPPMVTMLHPTPEELSRFLAGEMLAAEEGDGGAGGVA